MTRRAPSGASLRTLAPEDYRDIRRKYWAGVRQVRIASEYDVSQSTIARIVANLDGGYSGPVIERVADRARRAPREERVC